MSLLSVEGVSVRFGGVRALDELCVEIAEGEIVGVLGANGSGKSTLLDVISGLRACSGTVRFRGRDLRRVAAHRRHRMGISRSYQNLELSSALTVRETLLAGSRARGADARSEVDRVVALFDLEPVRAVVVGRLTYGMRKRVELARAFLRRPGLVLLDEPMAGLNDEEKGRITEAVRSITEQDAPPAVMLVEHDVSVVARLSDRVVALDAGRVIAEGAYEDVVVNPDVQRAYLGT